MGKLMHNTQIKHSSHPHLLQLSSNQNNNNCTCAGCNLLISSSDHIYACPPCNFFLHPSCSKFPELITHPSHRQHALSLLPTSIYPGGFFRCDACTQQGTRFSYHCQFCDFDLHVLCASKPLSVNHSSHPHPLVLTFSSPYGEKLGFSCDLCNGVGPADQWLYRCVSCEFDVHLHCATAKMPPPLQHSHSVPHQNQIVSSQMLPHSMSTGHTQTWQMQNPAPVGVPSYQQPQPQASVAFQRYQQPQLQASAGIQTYQQPQPQPQQQASVGFQSYQQPQPQPQQQASVGFQSYQQPQPQPQPQPQQQASVGFQSYQQPQPQPQVSVGFQSFQGPPQQQQQAPVSVQSYQMQPQPPMPAAANQNAGPGNGLADVMVTGFVDGMMQQLGQNFVQSLTGGGGGGDCGGGGGGGEDVVNIDFECSTMNEDYDN